MNNVTALNVAGQNSLAPRNLDEAMKFAEIMSRSNIVPKDYQGNPGNILVAVQWGMEIGLQPLQAMQNIAVINGRPSLWGDSLLALVQGSGLLESFHEEITADGATCTVKRKGMPEAKRTFLREDAKQAGLLGKQGPWTNYPKRMMQMRARAFALRDMFADVLKGMASAEEVSDMPVEKDMGAAQVVTPAPTKTAALKEKIAAKKGPKLADVIERIAASNTLDELAKAGEEAAKLSNDDDKEAARAAYKTKLADLSAPVETESAQQMTYAEIADKINHSQGEDEAAHWLSQAEHLPQDMQEELKVLADNQAARLL